MVYLPFPFLSFVSSTFVEFLFSPDPRWKAADTRTRHIVNLLNIVCDKAWKILRKRKYHFKHFLSFLRCAKSHPKQIMITKIDVHFIELLLLSVTSKSQAYFQPFWMCNSKQYSYRPMKKHSKSKHLNFQTFLKSRFPPGRNYFVYYLV
jgi:hypothetical protein